MKPWLVTLSFYARPRRRWTIEARAWAKTAHAAIREVARDHLLRGKGTLIGAKAVPE